MSKDNLTKGEKAARKKLQRFLCDKRVLAGIIAGAISGTVFTVLFLGFATGLIYKLIGSQDSITPDERTSRLILFFIPVIISGAGAFINFRSYYIRRRLTRISLDAIESRGELEKAASELESPDCEVFYMNRRLLSKAARAGTVASENYLFSSNNGTALRYDDIRRYSVFTSKGAAVVTQYLIVAAPDEKSVLVFYAGKTDRSDHSTYGGTPADRLIGIISERNPSAVFEEQKEQ